MRTAYIGERRSYFEGSGQRCTVKYVGTIPPWGSSVALGVEWDDPSRGRNDGVLDGVSYFNCCVPGTGSFIKADREDERKQTLHEALSETYLVLEDETLTSFSKSKSAEMYGFHKTHAIQQKIDKLETISVMGCRISSLDTTYNLDFMHSLELNDNLLEDFGTILKQISRFSSLRVLTLNGNRMIYNNDSEEVNSGIRELNMANTMINDEQVSCVIKAFPKLEVLNLAANLLTRYPENIPTSLRTLDLSNNKIHTVDLSKSSHALSNLTLTDNPIQNFVHQEAKVPTHLDLRGSLFNWSLVSYLGESSCTHLSLMHSENALEYRSYAIARCPNVTVLDGTKISAEERWNAEIYTLQSVVQKKHPLLPQHIWNSLTIKYGAPVAPPSASIRSRLIRFYVDNDSNPMRIVRDAPVYRLYMLISRVKNISLKSLRLKGIEKDDIALVSDFIEENDIVYTI